MADRTFPYGNFNYLVDLKGGVDPNAVSGGFSEVTGINTEITVAEYRNGNDPENHVRKIAGVYKSGDVTLKRGILGNSQDLRAWIDQTRKTGSNARRDVVVTMLDEARNTVQKWTLQGSIPMKYTFASLQAKGGTDVAIEELVLSVENLLVVEP